MTVLLFTLTAAFILGLGARLFIPDLFATDTGRHAGWPRHNPPKHTAAHAKPAAPAAPAEASRYVGKHDRKAALA